MKDKLEVGMYVRTEDGIIAKLIKIDKSQATDNKMHYFYTFDKQITKNYAEDYDNERIDDDLEVIQKEPSFNIIDLIEVGDYVNGYKVIEVFKGLANKVILEIPNDIRIIQDDYIKSFIHEEDIKEILTKEQYEERVYKVG